MGTILKGVHRVRWHELTHAYGTAEQVPGRLSRVAWGDPRAAEAALSDLGLWLAELSVFDATAAAVPFLWDLAATGTVTCRPDVLRLLRAVLAHGNPPHPAIQRAAHTAVLDGHAPAAALAEEDPDPAVRAAARELLTAIGAHTCGTCA
ncbi:hypothetical protein ACWERV_18315 [Streptomyces sp. NPDC004031]